MPKPTSTPKMKIKTIYIYPIKSLRGISIPTATLTIHGIPYDRQFMLLKDFGPASSGNQGSTGPSDPSSRYENMHVSKYASMVLFSTSLEMPSSSSEGEVTVTHRHPTTGKEESINIPLHPSTADLQAIDVKMHQSPVSALAMPKEYNEWFTARFGFDVVLAYLDTKGGRYRPVLGNLAPNASVRNPVKRAMAEEKVRQQEEAERTGKGWLSRFANAMPGLPTVFGNGGDEHAAHTGSSGCEKGTREEEDYTITFADCAPYLLASSTSLTNVSDRLSSEGKQEEGEMEMEKFRPNIVVEGASEAFEEDFWGEVILKPDEAEGQEAEEGREKVPLQLTANCVRCTSLNVDFSTGEFGKGEKGQILKKLQKDRRVDKGHKYGPVFGRYGFLPFQVAKDGRAFAVRVGDGVEVSRWNEERTTLMWPGLGTTRKEELYPLC